LASNATELFLHRSLEIMRIKDFFLRINTATDFPAKPDTTTFLDCMRYTGSGPSTTAIFEDSPVGIQCASATGAHVVEVKDVWDTIEKMRTF
jgi:HAD superfamily hydrolase (TIGR01509 family)